MVHPANSSSALTSALTSASYISPARVALPPTSVAVERAGAACRMALFSNSSNSSTSSSVAPLTVSPLKHHVHFASPVKAPGPSSCLSSRFSKGGINVRPLGSPSSSSLSLNLFVGSSAAASSATYTGSTTSSSSLPASMSHLGGPGTPASSPTYTAPSSSAASSSFLNHLVGSTTSASSPTYTAPSSSASSSSFLSHLVGSTTSASSPTYTAPSYTAPSSSASSSSFLSQPVGFTTSAPFPTYTAPSSSSSSSFLSQPVGPTTSAPFPNFMEMQGRISARPLRALCSPSVLFSHLVGVDTAASSATYMGPAGSSSSLSLSLSQLGGAGASAACATSAGSTESFGSSFFAQLSRDSCVALNFSSQKSSLISSTKVPERLSSPLKRRSCSSQRIDISSPSSCEKKEKVDRKENCDVKEQKPSAIKKRVPITDSIFSFLGSDYLVNRLASTGKMNEVWAFRVGEGLDDREIRIKDKVVRTSQLIIKCPLEYQKRDFRNPKGKQRPIFDKELRECIKTFIYFNQPATVITLQKLGLRIPTYYYTPLDLSDSSREEGMGFWIVEKMDKGVSCEEWKNSTKTFESLSSENRELLTFVKRILTYIASVSTDQDEKLRLLDFHPGNFMYNFSGAACYVDGSMQWGEDFSKDVISYAVKYATEWAGDNPNIKKFLIEDFPEDQGVGESF